MHVQNVEEKKKREKCRAMLCIFHAQNSVIQYHYEIKKTYHRQLENVPRKHEGRESDIQCYQKSSEHSA